MIGQYSILEIIGRVLVSAAILGILIGLIMVLVYERLNQKQSSDFNQVLNDNRQENTKHGDNNAIG